MKHTIQSLRQSGHKVCVLHSITDELEDSHPLHETSVWLADDGNPNTTTIEITNPDGKNFFGVAYRAKGDFYDRKKGNAIALGRALKQF